MNRTYDGIVIGAGHNGLACACHLARAGLRVLVVELHEHIGGMTATRERTLPGFWHDVHASGIQVANLSPSIAELGLEARGFDRLHPPVNYAHAFPDGRVIRFCREIDDTCASIASVSTHDARAWRALMDDYYAQKPDFVRGIFGVPEPGPVPAEQRMRLRDWLDGRFESDEMRAACAVWAAHTSLAPDDSGGVLATSFGPVIQDVGNNPVRGGMQRLPDALASHLLDHGGEIRIGARVERITTRAGRATGVRLADGSEITAKHFVACSANPVLLARDLLAEDDLDPDVTTAIRRVTHGLAQMTIWLALDRAPWFACGLDPRETLYVHGTDPGLDFFDTFFAQARAGILPEHPALLFVNEGAVDPSRVPEGRCSLKLIVMLLPFEIRGDATGRVPGRTWDEARDAYADHVLALAERHFAPGLGERVLARTVADPVTMSIDSPDCIRGDVCHVGVTPDQSGSHRPIPAMARYRTPLENLYLCGSGSHPGGGVTLASGYNAARTILDSLGLDPT